MAVRGLNVLRLGRQVRIYTDLPHHDETWASFLDRVAATYKIDRGTLVAQIVGTDTASQYMPIQGRLDAKLHQCLLQALQISEQQLPNDVRGIFASSMSQQLQTAYCPRCFLEDLSKQRTPYFRYQWTIPLITTCWDHAVPLMRWRGIRYADHRTLPVTWATDPSSSRAHECRWLDEDARRIDSIQDSRGDIDTPIDLLRRIERELIKIDVSTRTWDQIDGSDYAHPIFMALRLGSIRLRKSMIPLASLMCPAQGAAWFFGGPPNQSIRTMNLALRALRNSPLEWRRSMLWFAAALRYETGRRIALVNGDVVRPGSDEWLYSLKGVTDPWAEWHVQCVVKAFETARIQRQSAESMKFRSFAQSPVAP